MNSQQTNNTADDILDVIEMAIEKYTSKLRDNFIRTTVQEISSDYKYKVKINGSDYNVISGCGMQFNVGESVWVHIPNGDYSKAFICASANTRYIERETIVNVTEQVLANYVTRQFLQVNYLTSSDISSVYATKESVNNNLNNYLKITDYNTLIGAYMLKSDLQDLLSNYALQENVDDEFTKYVTTSTLNNRLVNYVTTNILENILANYVTNSILENRIANYITSEYVQQSITDALQNYYTKTEADARFELKPTDPEPTPNPDSGSEIDPNTNTDNNTDNENNTDGGGE